MQQLSLGWLRRLAEKQTDWRDVQWDTEGKGRGCVKNNASGWVTGWQQDCSLPFGPKVSRNLLGFLFALRKLLYMSVSPSLCAVTVFLSV